MKPRACENRTRVDGWTPAFSAMLAAVPSAISSGWARANEATWVSRLGSRTSRLARRSRNSGKLAGGAGRVRLTVRDSGLGIPQGEQERIFEKFYRLDPALTRGVGGSGLGLFISRELVSRMGGSLTVQSVPGAGAAFAVDLPAA